MTTSIFDPNRLSFDECLQRIRDAVERVPMRTDGIITSRTEGADALRKELQVDNVPDGFRKWQLPV